jgi:hypothetical protein
MFILYEKEKNKIKLSNVYDEDFNDDKQVVRENYVRDKILAEYLFLKNLENDKDKVQSNKISGFIVKDYFTESHQYLII